ncbi:unnamed protein product [Spirodela intermedia]|uniref:Uncharacterized protein n=1 Tax=Spirodela intermedia TaxID=51605 RepID=A0A7I8IVT6_SPIIN|nr:unnamed protein product [Spirodela intermedia]CAA6662106.1 unnamed protein product [Spirodela intermedia]
MAVLDEGSSSVASSPLQFLSLMSISRTALAAGRGSPPAAQEMKSDERGIFLIHLLLNCANYVAAGDLEHANACLEHIALLGASPDGDTMQRIAALFTDALARRLLRSSWPGIFRAITTTAGVGGATTAAPSPASAALLARRHFFDLCPFLKLSYVIANQAILEAMEGEHVIHLIDLHAADPSPWIALLQALSRRQRAPPTSASPALPPLRRGREARRAFPVQPRRLQARGSRHAERSLRVKTGEAVAVCSILQLHRLLAPDAYRKPSSPSRSSALRSGDSGVSSAPSPPCSTRMDAFLAALWGLAPKVMVVVEQESDHNGGSLVERFTEALNYYAALFDCLESAAAAAGGRGEERARVERALFGEEMRDIVATEGAERRERHERLERWLRRMDCAGFLRVPLSYYALLQARRLLQQGYTGCGGYGVRDEAGGCHALCWQDRALFSVSAWCCRRFD